MTYSNSNVENTCDYVLTHMQVLCSSKAIDIHIK